MNPNDPRHPWMRLTHAARRAPDAREASAPYGFSTRVAALAFAQTRRMPSLVERFALRAVAVASLLAIGSVVFNYRTASAPAPVATDERSATTDDAMAVLLDA